VGLGSQLAQSHFGVLHGIALGSECGITEARTTLFTLRAITSISTVKTASTLIAKTTFVRTRCAFAISAITWPTATCRSWYRFLLAGSVIAPHGHQGPRWLGRLNGLDGLCSFYGRRISFNCIGFCCDFFI
jgi:hypothetical protein